MNEIPAGANTRFGGLDPTDPESSVDSVNLSVVENVMRLFKTTIIVLEYIFPNTVEVVMKYVGWAGSRYMMRLTIARVAVKIENIIRLPSRKNNGRNLPVNVPVSRNKCIIL